jgi:hypothetical protein
LLYSHHARRIATPIGSTDIEAFLDRELSKTIGKMGLRGALDGKSSRL